MVVEHHAANYAARRNARLNTPAPRTAGEARRRHAVRCQQLTTLSRDPCLSSFTRAYWAAMAREALRLLSEIDEEIRLDGPDVPHGSRRAALDCSEPGCSETVWELAGIVWRAQRDGRALRLFCPEHTPSPTPPKRREPASAAELDELAEIAIGRLLALVPRLFAEPWNTPQMLALHHCGVLDRWIHSWRTNLWLLELNTGGPEAARARLRAAADEADLLHLLDASEPEPVVDAAAAPLVERPESESPQPEAPRESEEAPDEPPGDLPSGEPLDDEPEPDAWIF